MSLENQILDKENNKNLSEKENVNVISNSNILDNNNKINMTIKEKEEKNNNSNISSNKMKKIMKILIKIKMKKKIILFYQIIKTLPIVNPVLM